MNTPLVVWMTGFAAALAMMAPVFYTRRLPADGVHIAATFILAVVWPFLFLAVLYVLWADDHD